MTSENRSVGVVFSGGGGKGSYQIGVWRALDEYGVSKNVSAVAGTSVGALNAVLFKQGNWDIAEKIWLNLKKKDILHLTPQKIIEMLSVSTGFLSGMGLPVTTSFITRLAARGFFSRQGLEKISEEYIDWGHVAAPGCNITATALQIPVEVGRVEHFSLTNQSDKQCLSMLLASSAIPIIFPPEKIDGKKYIDGGTPVFGCNTPVEAVLNNKHGLIIVVLLNRNDTFDISSFPSTHILPIFPQEDQGGFLKGTLDFDGSHAAKRISQGYEDTKRILEPIYRIGKAQYDISSAISVAEKQQLEWNNIQKQLQQDREHLDEVSTKSSIEIQDAIKRISSS